MKREAKKDQKALNDVVTCEPEDTRSVPQCPTIYIFLCAIRLLYFPRVVQKGFPCVSHLVRGFTYATAEG